MALDGNEKDMVVTQLSLGGFESYITARALTDFLEREVGVGVWRCRLKTSSTPPDSYPDFRVQNTEDALKNTEYDKVVPHAFVHCSSQDLVKWVMDAVGRGDLIFANKPLIASLGPKNPFSMDKRRRSIDPHKLYNLGIEIGTSISRDELLVAWRGPSKDVDFYIDPFDATCKFCFTKDVAFAFKGQNKKAVIKCDFKLEFLVRDLRDVKQYTELGALVLLLQLESSPLVYYRTADDDIYVSVPFDLLDDDDPWIRTTDFTSVGAIGRCRAYKITLPPRNGPRLQKALTYLKERRVPFEQRKERVKVRDEPKFGTPMSDPFFCIQNEGLSFSVTFMLNAVLNKGIFNQHQVTSGLIGLLRSQTEKVNVAALEHLCSYKHPVFDAQKRLKVVQEWLMKNPKLMKTPRQTGDIVQIRRLIITPTKAYCLPPEVELSNRVLRHYKDVSDRFLRVTFMDEGMQTLNNNALNFYAASIVKDITKSFSVQRTTIYRRVNSILKDGFYCCGRLYSFLAFSSNQLRDRSAWFFAEDKNLMVSSIRSWMGKFTNKNVAKCTARMGLCFSSTYATVEVPHTEANKSFPDIERNNYVFSDGIGIITPDLAMEVAQKLQLNDNPPCAYQIRYAGCKGVVACWPRKEEDGKRLLLRPSMVKFESNHTMLEICSWTRFQPGFLNRQIVTLLSALQVPDEVFWRMQETMLTKLNTMFTDVDVAFSVLTESCAEQGNTAAIMLSSGFKPQTEPYLRGMLTCIRAAQLGDLREKARIFVPAGRWLMGCFDELAVLEQGQCFIQVSSPSLENCFCKHGSRFSDLKRKLQVVKGLVVVAKNPCLHPGDIRVLEAVDNPGLHHLYDCVVFPQKGDRPHADEASGSDLDGDLYFVTWDKNLIPPSKTSWQPMDYDPAPAKEQPRQVTIADIIEFFSRNMVNDHLGAICNAHVVHADISSYGALDEPCLKLAELAATAVDFTKTGKLVTMPQELKPKIYPDFMGKPDSMSYKSKKILGRLYRRIKDAFDEDVTSSSDLPTSVEDIPYDSNLEVPGYSDFLSEAWDTKCSYDRQIEGLLKQYKVRQEEEIVTGHVWSMPSYKGRKQGELKEKVKHAYSSLKKEFRQKFDLLGPEFDQMNQDERQAVYERKASAWYQVTYHPEQVKRALELRAPEAEENHKLSFAWIPADYLARIKVRCIGKKKSEGTSSKPIDSLAKFLSLRI